MLYVGDYNDTRVSKMYGVLRPGFRTRGKTIFLVFKKGEKILFKLLKIGEKVSLVCKKGNKEFFGDKKTLKTTETPDFL